MRDAKERPGSPLGGIPGEDVAVCMAASDSGVIGGNGDGGDRTRFHGWNMSAKQDYNKDEPEPNLLFQGR